MLVNFSSKTNLQVVSKAHPVAQDTELNLYQINSWLIKLMTNVPKRDLYATKRKTASGPGGAFPKASYYRKSIPIVLNFKFMLIVVRFFLEAKCSLIKLHST